MGLPNSLCCHYGHKISIYAYLLFINSFLSYFFTIIGLWLIGEKKQTPLDNLRSTKAPALWLVHEQLFSLGKTLQNQGTAHIHKGTHTHTHTHTHILPHILNTSEFICALHRIDVTKDGLRGLYSFTLSTEVCCAVLCLVTQSSLTFCNPMDCSLQGSSVHGDSPGKNIGVGCHALLQGIFPTQGSKPDLWHCRLIFNVWATKMWIQVKIGCWDMHTNILETMG